MTVEIPLTQGYVALVDDEDAPTLLAMGSWQVNECDGRLYAGHGQRGTSLRMHKVILGYDGGMVDHINGDGLDNRRANLRFATGSQNNANAGLSPRNTSGFKGVSLFRRTSRWKAYICLNNKVRHLGYYTTAEEAARAYDAAAFEQWGIFARLNFPRED